MANKKTVVIHAYKYDGQIYRCYETPAIISEDENYIVVDLYRTRINTYKAEADNNYFSKITYPCVWYFFKKEWFNIIVSNKSGRICYYVNVASPYLFEENTIKYIDFDLDFKIADIHHPQLVEVDIKEYAEHAKKYQYPEILQQKIQEVEQRIKDLFARKKFASFSNNPHLSYNRKKIDKKG